MNGSDDGDSDECAAKVDVGQLWMMQSCFYAESLSLSLFLRFHIVIDGSVARPKKGEVGFFQK
jgi:hypothetical protein